MAQWPDEPNWTICVQPLRHKLNSHARLFGVSRGAGPGIGSQFVTIADLRRYAGIRRYGRPGVAAPERVICVALATRRSLTASARGEDAEVVALWVGEDLPWHVALAEAGVGGA
jgi:hypothetical protein